MAKKQKFYAIVGSNGYGLFDNWSDCLYCLKYFRKKIYKKFQDLDNAYNWIYEKSFELAEERYVYYAMNTIDIEALKEQKLVFYSKMR